MNENKSKVWDVVVIGGGPAGMIASGRSAELGAETLLIEKNKTLGVKLLITGGGRCNLTNAETDTRKFLTKFKESSKFLFSAFSRYGVTETLDFFHSRNMPTKVENELRVFPVSDSAKSVWDVLVKYMMENKVAVMSDSLVMGFDLASSVGKDKIDGVKLKNDKIIYAKNFILATGGKSHPETGSTGDGFKWLSDVGHTISNQDSALVPLSTRDIWTKKLQGVTLKKVKMSVIQNNRITQKSKILLKKEGQILFTHFGITGPMILNTSKDIGELLKYEEVKISLDVLPSLNLEILDTKLRDFLREESNKKLKNSLKLFITQYDLPSALAPVITELSEVDEETLCHSITKENRKKLVHSFKNMIMTVSGLLGVEKAVITSGGVRLDEVDFKTMRSRIYSNLYLVGDILDIDRPTGGYGLQLCWTTGYLAGNYSASASLSGESTK